MKQRVMGLLMGAALLGASYAQAGIIIDNLDINVAQVARHDNGTYVVDPARTGAGILGTRTIDLTVTSDAGQDPGASNDCDLDPGDCVRVRVSGGFLTLSNDPGEQGHVTLTYENFGTLNLDPADTDKPWLVFGVTVLDHPLQVTAALTDINGVVGTNVYIKLDVASFNADQCDPAFIPCPPIVGPITAPLPANYYHALALFLGGGTDPVTNDPFGGNGALLLNSITKISLDFDTSGGELQLRLDCIHTAAAPSGAQPNADPDAIVFTNADDYPSDQCNAVVPEPASLLLMGTGLIGLGLAGLRARSLRRRQA